ncbi:colicin immunity domain-containing protein [Stenotrophomonas maltophilia]|uniref:colicin immunity domain-containing protein n=1 Tax=Stenotrophomonas maltophilia TaxID=40324 RepID=UPI00066CC076|nr:colicin immunity domain-containing protein [Stenotrophomonas maltophilia]KUJ04806.1 colicin immunity protein [Stenotrophomonas maltophilia]MBB5532250.1 5-methylthioribose kinase [Stenotrophomonas maltophilia]MCX3878319.1 colicin immunity domain-containing protein [Stenotrophomonas maltophilia]MDZ5778409.1 colicin immunity domain-containing protein [Stenotrophomonas maltophilia]NUH63281.1 colicin immunity protein [Stenotrophomonas maltophilia]
MSWTLMMFAQSFANERMSAQVFSESYIELWKIERDLDVLALDDAALSTCLSSIFCAADMYCDEEMDRHPYEIDAAQLHAAVVAQIDEWKQSTTAI